MMVLAVRWSLWMIDDDEGCGGNEWSLMLMMIVMVMIMLMFVTVMIMVMMMNMVIWSDRVWSCWWSFLQSSEFGTFGTWVEGQVKIIFIANFLFNMGLKKIEKSDFWLFTRGICVSGCLPGVLPCHSSFSWFTCSRCTSGSISISSKSNMNARNNHDY